MSEEIIIELTGEAAKQKRIEDSRLQKSLDSKWNIKQEQELPALIALNIRFRQYLGQYLSFSLDFLVLQTARDFHRRQVIVLQITELDKSKPVAMEKDTGKLIFINSALVRSDFEQPAAEMFIYAYAEKE